VEIREGIINEKGYVHMVLGKKVLDNGEEVTSTYIREAAMERQSPPQDLNASALAALPLENGFLPLLYFRTSTATLRIVAFNSREEQKSCSCRVRLQILWRSHILYTSQDDDEFIWLDDERDQARLQDKDCEFVLMSSFETLDSKTFNVMAIERDRQNIAHRLGLGVIRSETWDVANPMDEWVLLR
jgi:hypothetical protein